MLKNKWRREVNRQFNEEMGEYDTDRQQEDVGVTA